LFRLIYFYSLSGAFAKLQKAAISFALSVMSVCHIRLSVYLSVRRLSAWTNSILLGQIFMKFLYENLSKICLEFSSLIKV